MSNANGDQNATGDEVRRERIEWCDIWVPEANSDKLPRVLLVGDSITKGYYGSVDSELKGQAAVARLATSAFLTDPAFLMQLDCLLDSYDFDVIHFNNGLHGWGYSEQEYGDALPVIIQHLRDKEPGATLILANSTPLRDRADLSKLRDSNSRVLERNRLLAGVASSQAIPVNDLYSLVADKSELYSQDGTHFNNEGRALQGKQVAAAVAKALAERAQ
jgi:lysophospholipase L1-like esterase